MDKLFPLAFCIAGLALVAFGWKELSDGYSSTHWPTTEGVVIESQMARTGSGKKGFKPVVAYSYSFEGNSFSSERILFGMTSFRTIAKSSQQRAYEWLEKYPEGRSVTVAYDPSDPSNSTLNIGAHYTAWIAPVMGLVFLSSGIFLALPNKKKR
jgi:hypothetical protein